MNEEIDFIKGVIYAGLFEVLGIVEGEDYTIIENDENSFVIKYNNGKITKIDVEEL